MPAIPLIATGISSGVSLYNSHKQRQQQDKQQAPLLANAQQQGAQGKQLFNAGMPLLNKASGYYGSLLSGNRAEMTQAIQPETSALTDVYGGAARGLDRTSIQGPNRDIAKANLSRDLSGKIGGLIAGVRPGAAAATGALGGGMTNAGVGATAGAGGAYGSLLGMQQQQNQFNTGQSNMDWASIGTMMTNLLKSWKGGGGGGGNDEVSGWMSPTSASYIS